MAETKTQTPPSGGQLTKVETKPKMKVSSCRVRLSKDMDVFVKEITPAEALLLTAEHHKNVGDAVVHDLSPVQDRVTKKILDKDGKHIDNEVTHKDRTEVERTPAEEVQRLRSKY